MKECEIYCGDALEILRKLPSDSIHMCCTSPPYFGLRDYQIDGQLGLEKTPAEYVKNMVRVFRELRRVLRPDGTFWLNIGDTYASGGRSTRDSDKNPGRKMNELPADGFKPKNRIGIPHRLVFALQDDGWYWRDEIIWYAPNKMPESTRDRCTKSHEFVFMLTKSPRYFYDQHAIRERAATAGKPLGFTDGQAIAIGKKPSGNQLPENYRKPRGDFANKRSVWTIPTQGNNENHFAAYPRKLVLPCLLAGTSEKGCCPKCGAPWKRILEKVRTATRPALESKVIAAGGKSEVVGNKDPERHVTAAKTIGWEPTCECGKGRQPVPCVVLDPFGGTGTTAAVAVSHNRRAITMDLNPEYVEYIRRKVKKAIAKKGFGL